MMMHMTLYWGKELTLLFDSWKTESWLSYSFTLLFCFLLSLFHQRLEAQRFKFKSIKKTLPPPPSSSSGHSSGSSVNTPLIFRKLSQNRCARITSAALFGLTSAIGYVIMLSIMSYNGGVFVAVVLGLSIGYFLFRSGDLLEEENVGVAVEDNACACS